MQHDLTILWYSCNKVPEILSQKVKEQIKYAAPDIPIVSITQKPIDDMGTNVCVGDIGQSLKNVYIQALEGAKLAKTKYVACCEDDTFYIPGHFTAYGLCCKAPFVYNTNRWNCHTNHGGLYTYRRRPVFGMCLAVREILIKCIEDRLMSNGIEADWGEPGIYESRFGLHEYDYTTFETTEPCLVIAHKDNTTGVKLKGKDADPVEVLPPWGNGKALLKHVYYNGVAVEEKPRLKTKKLKRSQYSYIKSKVFSVDELCDNREEFCDPRKPRPKSIDWFPPFIKAVHEGKTFSDDELTQQPYCGYMIDQLNPADRIPVISKKGKRHVINQLKDGIKLYHDIKEHGLKAPLDMWWHNKNKLVLHRGSRRLAILKILGIDKVPCRVFKDRASFIKFSPDKSWATGVSDDPTIHNLAINQFLKYGEAATDKYWVHGYTRLYDREFEEYRGKEIKLLEIGVKRGASLLLWKNAFPDGAICGIDIDPITRPIADLNAFKIFTGSQDNINFLKNEVIPAGPYNIIIDDGSHVPAHQKITFETLWPAIAPGGTYVVEDLHHNYRDTGEMISLSKDMVDSIYRDPSVFSVKFYYNIVFIKKI